jgi:hypothetical protein
VKCCKTHKPGLTVVPVSTLRPPHLRGNAYASVSLPEYDLVSLQVVLVDVSLVASLTSLKRNEASDTSVIPRVSAALGPPVSN